MPSQSQHIASHCLKNLRLDCPYSSSYQTEVIRAGNGQQLLNTQVDQLIQAMANFSSQTGLTWEQGIAQRPQDVQAILAANWQ